MKSLINPGCFGSPVFFRYRSEICERCPSALSCAEHVQRASSAVMDKVTELDKRFQTNRAPTVESILKLCWQEDKPKRDTAKSILEQWSRDNVNPYMLTAKINPIKDTEDVDCFIFGFVINTGPFKVRDLVEHLVEEGFTKATIRPYCNAVCNALLKIKVLKTEGGVLWL